MRSSAIEVLSLVILIATVILTSPVPDPANNIKAWAPTTDTEDNDITDHDTSISRTDLLNNNEDRGGNWPIRDCPDGQAECHFHELPDENKVGKLLMDRSDLSTAVDLETATDAEVNWQREEVCYKIKINGKIMEECRWRRPPPSKRSQNNNNGAELEVAETPKIATDAEVTWQREKVCYKINVNGKITEECRWRRLPPSKRGQNDADAGHSAFVNKRAEMEVTETPDSAADTEVSEREKNCHKIIIAGKPTIEVCRPRWMPPNRRDQYESGGDTAVVVKKSEIGAPVASAPLVSGTILDTSTSKTLLGRELIDPNLLEINKPCALDIISKHNGTGFNTLSMDAKKAVLIEIFECVYDASTDSNNAGKDKTTDVVYGSTAQRCSHDLIQNTYLQIHWDFLEEKNKLIAWMVLAYCMSQEPKNGQLQVRQEGDSERARISACIKTGIQLWGGNLSTKQEVSSLIVAIKGCTIKPWVKVSGRDFDHFIPVPIAIKEDQCMKRVKESWTGDFSGREERDAFMLEVMRCGNNAQG